MDDLISRQKLIDEIIKLETSALDYIHGLIKGDGCDGRNVREEYKVWTAVRAERTAFKHEVMDAPSVQIDIEPKRGRWISKKSADWAGGGATFCSCCDYGYSWIEFFEVENFNYCPNCGARMET